MSAAQDFSLDQLVDESGDESFEMGRTPTFKNNVAYPVEVTEQEVVTTDNGWYMAKFKLGRVFENGEVGRSGTVIQCLPHFSQEIKDTQDVEKLNDLRQNWGGRLHGILRAFMPTTFSVYATSSGKGRTWKAFDFEGAEMSKAEIKSREELLPKAVLGASKRMETGTFSLVGTRGYYVRAQDKKNPEKTYDQFYSDLPRNYPLAE